MIMPVCPRCDVPLKRHMSHNVFQYVCPQKHGFTAHFKELENVLPAHSVNELWLASKRAPESEGAKCSHCRKSMRSVIHAVGNRNIELDVCRRCTLTWLDAGEWGDLDSEEEKTDAAVSSISAPTQSQRTPGVGFERAEMDSLWKIMVTIVGLPTEEEPDQFQSKPWLTWLLIGLCVAATVFAMQNIEFALKHLAFIGGRSIAEMSLSSFTSFFVHGGWLHLLSNLYFLWVFGDNVEDHIGKLKYAIMLLVASAAGDLLYVLFDSRSATVPEVGASAGIFALISFYLIRFPHRRFVVFALITWLAIPSWVLGALFLIIEGVGVVSQINGQTSTSHLAHLGGALVGIAFAVVISPFRHALKPAAISARAVRTQR